MQMTIHSHYRKLLDEAHILIAGSTGTGKSVLINNLIYTALQSSPDKVQFILIDPKRVELNQYSLLPHTLDYASEPEAIVLVLQKVVDFMERRFQMMQYNGLKKYPGSQVYVIIDEFADLMTTSRMECTKLLCRIAQLGRASGIHLWVATQRPTRDIVTGQIKTNLDCRIALRVPTAQDSRNIINIAGAEDLPRYGQAIIIYPPEKPMVYDIPMIPENEIGRLVHYWRYGY